MLLKKASVALALVGAMTAAHADISQGFDAGTPLTDWTLYNATTPGSNAWLQAGSAPEITSHSGDPLTSFLISNYGTVDAGQQLANWLISPVFSTAQDLEISFWAIASIVDGFSDHIAYGLVNEAGDLLSFVEANNFTVAGDWTQYALSLTGTGDASTKARFAILYFGDADTSNYVGIDDFAVTTAAATVPEPASWALAAVSLLGLGVARRRNRR